MDLLTYIENTRIKNNCKINGLQIMNPCCRVFIVACSYESDISILNYIINMGNKLGIDLKNIIFYNLNGFLYACKYNKNLQVIKYLINELNFDINCVDAGNNCLLYACFSNENVEIIKYFVKELNMNINHKNHDGKNILHSACMGNKNIEVIKYLIENLQMDIYEKDYYGFNCFSLVFYCTNTDFYKYFLEIVRIKIEDLSLYTLDFVDLTYFIYIKTYMRKHSTNKYKKMRNFLSLCDIII